MAKKTRGTTTITIKLPQRKRMLAFSTHDDHWHKIVENLLVPCELLRELSAPGESLIDTINRLNKAYQEREKGDSRTSDKLIL